MPDLTAYIEAWRERVQTGRRRSVERQRELVGAARAIAQLLAREYGATEVVLFGSVARGEVGSDSDIDLLVDGIDDGLLIAAMLAAERLSCGAGIDLVPRRQARPEILTRALQEGTPLHA